MNFTVSFLRLAFSTGLQNLIFPHGFRSLPLPQLEMGILAFQLWKYFWQLFGANILSQARYLGCLTMSPEAISVN